VKKALQVSAQLQAQQQRNRSSGSFELEDRILARVGAKKFGQVKELGRANIKRAASSEQQAANARQDVRGFRTRSVGGYGRERQKLAMVSKSF
jgi:hypothetical protein